MAKIVWTDDKKKKSVDFILCEISEGKSVRSIFADSTEELPNRSTFNKWLSEDPSLKDQYARACEDRSDIIFDEIIEISNESNADLEINEKGHLIINGEAVQRSRLKIDARKWVLSKMNPKKYGDKVDVTTDGEKVNSVTIFELPNNGRD